MVSFRRWWVVGLLGLAVSPALGVDSPERLLRLERTGPDMGPLGRATQAGEVEIEVVGGRTRLELSLFGLAPSAVHTVWLEFDIRQAPFTGAPPDVFAVDPDSGARAPVYLFTPASADDAAFTSGIGLDPNGFVTDASGNAAFRLELNYDVDEPRTAPIVLRPGVTQAIPVAAVGGRCVASSDANYEFRHDSAFMRAFDPRTVAQPPGRSPSFPLLVAPLRPKLVRGTVNQITIAEHFDGMTHGHARGLGLEFGPCGDHAPRMRGLLANAVPKLR